MTYCESCEADRMWEEEGIPAMWAEPTHTCGNAGALELIAKTLDNIEAYPAASWTSSEVAELLDDVQARIASPQPTDPSPTNHTIGDE